MHYQTCNVEDEFEPRITPKPAVKFDSFAIPSVPEVSLILEKPIGQKNLNPNSPLRKSYDSYATWKEQNFSLKTANSKLNDSITTPRIRHDRHYVQPSSEEKGNRNVLEHKKNEFIFRKSIGDNRDYEEYEKPAANYEHGYNATCHMHKEHCMISKQTQSTNMQCNNNVYKRHSDPIHIAPHVFKQQLNTSHSDTYEHRHKQGSSPSEKKVVSHTPISRNKIHAHNSHSESNFFPTKKEYHPVPHIRYPCHVDINGYALPQFCPPNYSNHNTDNNETIKNLLQLVSNQNEQIKVLQLQISRLLKIQEESFKDKSKCMCSSHSIQQSTQLNVDMNDTTYAARSQNQSSKQDVQHSAATIDKSKESICETKNGTQRDLILGEQSKKAFVEQKVSIGVMTSFEFTVQNNSFVLDSEDYSKNEIRHENEKISRENNMNMCDADVLRRYKTFSRIPRRQLENIVEDSESYLSSSQQQSSNLNASCSTKALDLEKQNHIDIQDDTNVYNAQNISQSPKSYESIHRYHELEKKRKLLEKPFNKELEKTDVRRQQNIEVDSIQNALHRYKSYKPSTNIAINQSTKLGTEVDNYSSTRNTVNTATTNCHQDYPKEKYANVKQSNRVEDSLILSGADLKVNERPPPTPEPSIHVDMHEYSSDDDSDKVKKTSKVGWTFYNNVLGQVNQILQNSGVIDKDKKEANNEQDDIENKTVMDTVKVATLEQLRKLGISLTENNEQRELNGNKRMEFDSSFYPRLDCQTNMTHATSAVNETNTSMHMKALALKYLSDEQLADLALQKQGATSLKHFMVSNVQGTNMSFATMRYLERYQLLPGKNNIPVEGNSKICLEALPKPDLKATNPKSSPALKQFPFAQTPRTSCPSKILDISTLKQQPKLL